MNIREATKLLNLKKKITSKVLTKLTISDTGDLSKFYIATEALDRIFSKHMGYSKNS